MFFRPKEEQESFDKECAKANEGLEMAQAVPAAKKAATPPPMKFAEPRSVLENLREIGVQLNNGLKYNVFDDDFVKARKELAVAMACRGDNRGLENLLGEIKSKSNVMKKTRS